MYVTDHQIGRYFRRIQLGFRFLAHGARTQTTCQWTGLTPDQLATLRRRWLFNADDRLRGPSPSSFGTFFASRRRRAHAALFLSISRIVGAAPALQGAEAARGLAGLNRGERLCEAFEIFREWVPDAELDFEQVHLLLTGAVNAEHIALGQCDYCSAAILIDKLGPRVASCHCQRGAPRQRERKAATSQQAANLTARR